VFVLTKNQSQLSLLIRELSGDDDVKLQELFEQCHEYAEVTFGLPVGEADALSQYFEGLQYCPPAHKFLIGVWGGGRLFAAADFLAHFPTPDSGAIALLIVNPDSRRMGIGRYLLASIEASLISSGVRRVRFDGHVQENVVGERFLRSTGWSPEPGVPQIVGDGQLRTHILWNKRLKAAS